MNFLTIPNIVTSSRVFLIPFLIYSMHKALADASLAWWIVCLVILIICEVSDALDGHIARAINQVSDIGKLLDPLCDSLLRFSIFLTFNQLGLIPNWTVFIFFYRDLAVAYLRIQAMSGGVVFAARFSGKLKAIVQAIGVFLIIIVQMIYDYDRVHDHQTWVSQFLLVQDPKVIYNYTMWVVCGVTVWSGFDYAYVILNMSGQTKKNKK